MAEIFNARDLILQGTVPRLTVTAVTILPGASGFLKDKNVLALSPATLNLTTVLVGFTAAATYEWYYASSLNPSTFTLLVSGTSYTSYSITNTAFFTHVGLGTSVIYKCKVTQPGWADAETTTTINYTKRANDVPVATLNKTSIVLPATVSDVVDYSNTDCDIKVSIGGVNIPYSATATANTFTVVTSITSGTITAGTASTTTTTVSNDTRTFGNLSAMAAGLSPATITYTVTARDVDGVATTITLTQTITKASSGASGYVYKLIVPSIVMRRLDNTNFIPTTITASATLGVGTTAAVAYAGVFKIYTSTDGSTYILRNTSGTVSSYAYTLQDYLSVYTTNIKVELYLNDGTTFIDSEIIPVSREGQYSLNLTNDNHTISTSADGTSVLGGLPTSTEAEIYFGLTKILTGWTYSWAASTGITFNTTAAVNASIAQVTSATQNGTLTVTATETASSNTRTAVFSISRVAQGTDAINIDLLSESDVTSALSDGTGYSLPTNNEIRLYKGGTLLTTGIAYGPATSTVSGLTATVNATTGVVTFSGGSWNADQASFIFTALYNSITYNAVYTYVKSKQGFDAVIIDLISEADVVSATSAGVVSALPTGNSVKLYKGGSALASGVVYGPASTTQNGLTLAVNTSTGAITLSGTWTSDQENFTLTAVYNSITYTTKYSIAKSKAGAAGVNAKTITLTNNKQAFTFDGTNTLSPAGQYITFTVAKQNTTNTVNWTITASDVAAALSSSNTVQTFATTGDTIYLLASQFGANTSVTVTATVVDGTTLTDTTTIVRLQNGGAGLSALLTNESHTVPTDSAGANGVYTGSGTNIYVYEGATALVYDGTGTANGRWTVSAAATSITAGAITDGGDFAIVAAANAISADTASIAYTITGKTQAGSSFSLAKTQTFSRSKAGTNGADSTIAGPSGATAVTAYKIVAGASLPSAPTAPSGAPISGNATGTTNWYTSPATSLTGTQWLFQASGTLLSGTYTWNAQTFLATFKVGVLSALSADVGTITAGTITGATIRTAASGSRVELNATDLKVYSGASAVLTVGPGAGSGGITSQLYNYTATTSNYFDSVNNQIGIDINSANRLVIGSTGTPPISYIATSFAPGATNTYELGLTGLRWQNIYTINAVTVGSDARLKTDVQTSVLGLNFINALNPVSYKLIQGSRVETGEFEEITTGTFPTKVPIYQDVPGVRKHYGLIAQEVKVVLDNLNTGDFGGFVLEDKDDPNSLHSLRYEEFISPLIKAVQELSAKITALENRLNS